MHEGTSTAARRDTDRTPCAEAEPGRECAISRGRAGSRRVGGREAGERRKRPLRKAGTSEKTGAAGKIPEGRDGTVAGSSATGSRVGTPLRIPYGNKELAFRLGARYGADGWYAPPGVDLAGFRERGWL